MDVIISALITAGASVLAVVITNIFNNKKIMAEMKAASELSDSKLEARIDKYEEVSRTKIEALTREVRLHNNFAQKIPVLEQRVSTLEKKEGL